MDPRHLEAELNAKQGIKTLQESWGILSQYWLIDVKARQFYFSQLRKHGFTRKEALALTLQFQPFPIYHVQREIKDYE